MHLTASSIPFPMRLATSSLPFPLRFRPSSSCLLSLLPLSSSFPFPSSSSLLFSSLLFSSPFYTFFLCPRLLETCGTTCDGASAAPTFSSVARNACTSAMRTEREREGLREGESRTEREREGGKQLSCEGCGYAGMQAGMRSSSGFSSGLRHVEYDVKRPLSSNGRSNCNDVGSDLTHSPGHAWSRVRIGRGRLCVCIPAVFISG